MESISQGQLVNVNLDGHPRDGIVFEMPSASKVVVAMVDRRRGPSFRTVPREALTERTQDGEDDPALRRLIRRTPPSAQGGVSGATGPRSGRAGHTRAAMHRTTGR